MLATSALRQKELAASGAFAHLDWYRPKVAVLNFFDSVHNELADRTHHRSERDLFQKVDVPVVEVFRWVIVEDDIP